MLSRISAAAAVLLVTAVVGFACADGEPSSDVSNERLDAIEAHLDRVEALLETAAGQVELGSANRVDQTQNCPQTVSIDELGLFADLTALEVELRIADDLIGQVRTARAAGASLDPALRYQLEIAQIAWRRGVLARELTGLPEAVQAEVVSQLQELDWAVGDVQAKIRAAAELDWERFDEIEVNAGDVADQLGMAMDVIADSCAGRAVLNMDREQLKSRWRLLLLGKSLSSAIGGSCIAFDCLHGPRRLDAQGALDLQRFVAEMDVVYQMIEQIDGEHILQGDGSRDTLHGVARFLLRHHVPQWRDHLQPDNPMSEWAPSPEIWVVLESVNLYTQVLFHDW